MPYEILNKKFRTAQKTIDREVANVLGGSNEILQCSSDPSNQSIESVTNFLGGVVQKLTALKRKVLNHLREIATFLDGSYVNNKNISRVFTG